MRSAVLFCGALVVVAAEMQFGFFDFSATPPAGWQVMSLADINDYRTELISYYNANNGFLLVEEWTSENCCVAVSGGDKLVISDTQYGYQFMANPSNGAVDCTPAGGYTLEKYQFYGLPTIAADATFSSAVACQTNKNPGIFMFGHNVTAAPDDAPSQATTITAIVPLDSYTGNVSFSFGLYDYSHDPGGGWRVMRMSDILAYKTELVEYYNTHGGLHLVKNWTAGNCCVAMADGSKLVISGTLYGFQFLAIPATGAVDCTPEGGYQLPVYQFYGLLQLNASAGFSSTEACVTSHNPAIFMLAHTSAPTAAPTPAPSPAPTASPTAAPTAAPSVSPTASPTVGPTAAPSASPTASPTQAPTNHPVPTTSPTPAPTDPPPTPQPTSPTSNQTAGSTSTTPPAPTPVQAPVVVSVNLRLGGVSAAAFSAGMRDSFRGAVATHLAVAVAQVAILSVKQTPEGARRLATLAFAVTNDFIVTGRRLASDSADVEYTVTVANVSQATGVRAILGEDEDAASAISSLNRSGTGGNGTSAHGSSNSPSGGVGGGSGAAGGATFVSLLVAALVSHGAAALLPTAGTFTVTLIGSPRVITHSPTPVPDTATAAPPPSPATFPPSPWSIALPSPGSVSRDAHPEYGGAVAGVLGGLLGCALLSGLALKLSWRRRKSRGCAEGRVSLGPPEEDRAVQLVGEALGVVPGGGGPGGPGGQPLEKGKGGKKQKQKWGKKRKQTSAEPTEPLADQHTPGGECCDKSDPADVPEASAGAGSATALGGARGQAVARAKAQALALALARAKAQAASWDESRASAQAKLQGERGAAAQTGIAVNDPAQPRSDWAASPTARTGGRKGRGATVAPLPAARRSFAGPIPPPCAGTVLLPLARPLAPLSMPRTAAGGCGCDAALAGAVGVGGTATATITTATVITTAATDARVPGPRPEAVAEAVPEVMAEAAIEAATEVVAEAATEAAAGAPAEAATEAVVEDGSPDMAGPATEAAAEAVLEAGSRDVAGPATEAAVEAATEVVAEAEALAAPILRCTAASRAAAGGTTAVVTALAAAALLAAHVSRCPLCTLPVGRCPHTQCPRCTLPREACVCWSGKAWAKRISAARKRRTQVQQTPEREREQERERERGAEDGARSDVEGDDVERGGGGVQPEAGVQPSSPGGSKKKTKKKKTKTKIKMATTAAATEKEQRDADGHSDTGDASRLAVCSSPKREPQVFD